MSTREELAKAAADADDAYDAIWHAVIAAEDVWLAAEEALAAYDNENT